MGMAAIILVAGSGTRMGAGINKQLLMLDGVTVTELTIWQFVTAKEISQVVLVTKESEARAMEALVPLKWRHKVTMALGGKERMHSVQNGVKALNKDITHVLVQDGARPFVTKALLKSVIDGLLCTNFKALIPALSSKDTLKRVNGETQQVSGTIDRSEVYRVQTPQGFERQLLERMQLFVEASSQTNLNPTFTDDASIAEAMGEPVFVVPGCEWNIKLTTPEDLVIGQAIFRYLLERGELICE